VVDAIFCWFLAEMTLSLQDELNFYDIPVVETTGSITISLWDKENVNFVVLIKWRSNHETEEFFHNR
jgi:hypothetical protein